jgi:prophage regulatory protein
MIHTILRLPQVKQRTGLSRSSIYQKVSKKEFPAPISLGMRSVGWVDQEISDWVTQRVNQSRPKQGGKTE